MARSVAALVAFLAIAGCDSPASPPAPSNTPPAATGSVGASLDFKGPDLIFSRIFMESPAARAGIKIGDRILKINGLATSSMTMDGAKSVFKGAAGTSLTVSVATGTGAPRDVTLTREILKSKVPMPDPAAAPAVPVAPAATGSTGGTGSVAAPAAPPVPAPAPAAPAKP